MSIASEITRIKSNIAAAYTAANEKGASMPQTQNSANLANTIGSIPQTGSIPYKSVVVNGTGEVVIQDNLESTADQVKIYGYTDVLYGASTQAAYAAYGFNIGTNPSIVAKDEEETVLSTSSFSGVELLEIKCIYDGGTVHERFRDSITLNADGTATVDKQIGKITIQDIINAAANNYTNVFSFNSSPRAGQLRVMGSSGIWQTYQCVPAGAATASTRPAVVCNLLPPRTNQTQGGYVDVSTVNGSPILDIVFKGDILPNTVVDADTFKSWLINDSGALVYLPYIIPVTTTVQSTAVVLDDEYTEISTLEKSDISVTYKQSIVKENTNRITALEERADETDPLNQMRYHVASIISKMCVCGDSLSVGWGLTTNSDTPTDSNISLANKNISWVQQYGRLTGTEMLNIGASGMSAENFWDDMFSIPNHPNGSFDDYLNYLDEECEVYVIGLGLNFNAATAGTISDIGQTAATCNEDTFCGAYAKIILTITEKYPNAKVICLTIPETGKTTQNTLIRSIVETVSGTILIDLEADYIDLFTRTDLLSQRTVLRNVHFYPIGYSLIAQTMERIFSDYLWQNAEDFRSFGIV